MSQFKTIQEAHRACADMVDIAEKHGVEPEGLIMGEKFYGIPRFNKQNFTGVQIPVAYLESRWVYLTDNLWYDGMLLTYFDVEELNRSPHNYSWTPPKPEPVVATDWEHSSNEWADMAVNGLQYLKNLRDGIGNFDDAIKNMESQIIHCKNVSCSQPQVEQVAEPKHFPDKPDMEAAKAALRENELIVKVAGQSDKVKELEDKLSRIKAYSENLASELLNKSEELANAKATPPSAIPYEVAREIATDFYSWWQGRMHDPEWLGLVTHEAFSTWWKENSHKYQPEGDVIHWIKNTGVEPEKREGYRILVELNSGVWYSVSNENWIWKLSDEAGMIARYAYIREVAV